MWGVILFAFAAMGILLFLFGKYISIVEGLGSAIAVAVLVGSNTAGIHMLFRIILTIAGAGIVFYAIWWTFRTTVGFWVLTSVFSCAYAFMITSNVWTGDLLDWGVWSTKWWPEDYPDGIRGFTDGDLIWTIFAGIASLAVSFWLHYRAKKEWD